MNQCIEDSVIPFCKSEQDFNMDQVYDKLVHEHFIIVGLNRKAEEEGL